MTRRVLSGILAIAGVVLAGGLGIFLWPAGEDAGVVDVAALSPLAERGRAAFDAHCVKCHGIDGSGTDMGPPLVHDIYNPGHHGDAAFVRAVKEGTPQHHWPFGDMPPQPQVTEAEIAAIIRYVRELQAANGITARPHVM